MEEEREGRGGEGGEEGIRLLRCRDANVISYREKKKHGMGVGWIGA